MSLSSSTGGRLHRHRNSRRRNLRVQLLNARCMLAGDWCNPSNPVDVNDDDTVSALDALMIINHINATETSASGEPIAGLGTEFYPDANGDGSVSALDALTVINRIGAGEPIEAPAPDLSIVDIRPFPTPATDVVTGLTSFQVQIQNEGDPFGAQTAVQTRVSVAGTDVFSQQTALLRSDETLDAALLTIDARYGDLPNGIYDLVFEVDPAVIDNVDETDEDNNSITVTDGLRVLDGTVAFSFAGFETMDDDPVDPPPITSLLDFPGLRKFEVDDDIEIDLVANGLTVTISTPMPGFIRIEALGLFEDVPLSEDLEISAGGMGNTIIFNGAVIPEDLEIDLRGGNHRVRLMNTLIGDDFEFDGSGGSDTILIEGNTSIRDDVDIETGGGADFILIKETFIGDDLEVEMDHGADSMIMDGAIIGDDVDVEMGDGDDQVWTSLVEAGDEIELEGDDGIDLLAVDQASIRADEIDVKDFSTPFLPRNARASIDEIITVLFA